MTKFKIHDINYINIKYNIITCRDIPRKTRAKFMRTNVVCPSVIQFLEYPVSFLRGFSSILHVLFSSLCQRRSKNGSVGRKGRDTQTYFLSFLLPFVPISCVSVSIETFKDYRNRCDISRRRV